jgi:hypothetical protein
MQSFVLIVMTIAAVAVLLLALLTKILRAFHEKAISVKPTVAAVTVLEDRDDCALALASIRTVDGSAFW